MDINKYLSDYEVFTESETAEITQGITLKNGIVYRFCYVYRSLDKSKFG